MGSFITAWRCPWTSLSLSPAPPPTIWPPCVRRSLDLHRALWLDYAIEHYAMHDYACRESYVLGHPFVLQCSILFLCERLWA
jgi:hypothetical protein